MDKDLFCEVGCTVMYPGLIVLGNTKLFYTSTVLRALQPGGSIKACELLRLLIVAFLPVLLSINTAVQGGCEADQSLVGVNCQAGAQGGVTEGFDDNPD